MHLADVRGQELEDLKQIEQALIERYHRHAWDLSDFFVIETLVSGRSAIIVANSKHASATLGLSVSIPETLPTDVRGNLALASRITNTKGVAFHSITNTEVTPLVRLARLVDPLLGKPRLKMKSPTSGVYEQPFLETGIDYTSS